MRLPGKRTIDRLINYHAVSTTRIRRYLDELRLNVESFPANEANRIAMDELIEFVQKVAPSSFEAEQILDIGCGDGYILNRIRAQHRQPQLRGISICRGDIDLARKLHGINVKFGDMQAIPLREG